MQNYICRKLSTLKCLPVTPQCLFAETWLAFFNCWPCMTAEAADFIQAHAGASQSACVYKRSFVFRLLCFSARDCGFGADRNRVRSPYMWGSGQVSFCKLTLGMAPGEWGYYWSGGGNSPHRHVRSCLRSSTAMDWTRGHRKKSGGETKQ